MEGVALRSEVYPRELSRVEAREIPDVAKRFQEFLAANRQGLLRKYGAGKFLAVVDEKVVAVADSADEAYEEARRRCPKDFILTASTDGTGDILVPHL